MESFSGAVLLLDFDLWSQNEKAFFQKAGRYRAPATQDATMSADKIRSDEKVCFFYTFLQGINKTV
jgi:hypothetical protein